ncbi:MAG: branched-chain amino acid ABC transporter permease [Devosia sp.]
MMHSFILQLLNGMSLAALLFLLASGFTLTFGLARVVNMAHGAYYLLGGYVGLQALDATGSFLVGVLAGGFAIVALNLVLDRFLIARTKGDPLLQVLLTIGITYVIAEGALLIWGGDPLRVAQPEWARGPVVLPGDIFYPKYRFFLIVLGVAVAALLWALYRLTPIGAIVRAGVDDREMTEAVGVNIGLLFALVFSLAAFLAGASGVLGGAFLTLYPHAEWDILILALVVVIIGGLGSIEGAMAGSLFVGLIDSFGRWLVPEAAGFLMFGPMALLLLMRPQGLFGRAH